MKKSLILIFIALAVIFGSITSCKKYEDGPLISFRSKKARITNTWKIEQQLVNGTQTSFDTSYRLKLEDGGIITKSTSIGNITTSEKGSWDFSGKKEDVQFTFKSVVFINAYVTTTYKILRLKEDELWLKTTDSSGNETEVHYITA